MRLKHLEEQAMFALKIACENYDNAVFPNALIAGDCVITHLLSRLGYLQDGKCKVMVVDTFHLFPETMEFLDEIEKEYGFKAEVFCADGVPVGDKAAFDKKYGADLWKVDIDEYDRVCKVEPFQRGLKTLNTDCMINGRTRWQGAERAWIDMFENAPIGGGLAKCNPLAYWTLEDTFDYIAKYKVPAHPLHAKGYPSIGDAKDTIPIPEDGSVKFVDFKFEGDKTEWLDYGNERKGRFVGLANKDGSTKTECGIHVTGAEKTWDRDLWEADKSAVKKITTTEEALAVKEGGKPAVMVVYAPWCQFSQVRERKLVYSLDVMYSVLMISFLVRRCRQWKTSTKPLPRKWKARLTFTVSVEMISENLSSKTSIPAHSPLSMSLHLMDKQSSTSRKSVRSMPSRPLLTRQSVRQSHKYISEILLRLVT